MVGEKFPKKVFYRHQKVFLIVRSCIVGVHDGLTLDKVWDSYSWNKAIEAFHTTFEKDVKPPSLSHMLKCVSRKQYPES